ncbi:MAG TPA: hypothetical protein VG621_02420 [Candidatus Paceibacterota bacterium]|nr:hypothetical protein [Candidatus Paceibacterota bacterium]
MNTKYFKKKVKFVLRAHRQKIATDFKGWRKAAWISCLYKVDIVIMFFRSLFFGHHRTKKRCVVRLKDKTIFVVKTEPFPSDELVIYWIGKKKYKLGLTTTNYYIRQEGWFVSRQSAEIFARGIGDWSETQPIVPAEVKKVAPINVSQKIKHLIMIREALKKKRATCSPEESKQLDKEITKTVEEIVFYRKQLPVTLTSQAVNALENPDFIPFEVKPDEVYLKKKVELENQIAQKDNEPDIAVADEKTDPAFNMLLIAKQLSEETGAPREGCYDIIKRADGDIEGAREELRKRYRKEVVEKVSLYASKEVEGLAKIYQERYKKTRPIVVFFSRFNRKITFHGGITKKKELGNWNTFFNN